MPKQERSKEVECVYKSPGLDCPWNPTVEAKFEN